MGSWSILESGLRHADIYSAVEVKEVLVPADAPTVAPSNGEQVSLVIAKDCNVYSQRAIVTRSRLTVADVQALERCLRGDLGVVGRAPASGRDPHRATVSAAQQFQLVQKAGLELHQSAAALAPQFCC